MPVTSYQLFTGPWQSIPWLISETERFYAMHVTPRGLGDPYSLAAKKIIPLRNWEPSLGLIEARLDAIVRELEIFYVPKQMDPGPCICFPIRDVHNNIERLSDRAQARIKPLYNLLSKDGAPIKYALLGKTRQMTGPSWFGQSQPTIVRIGQRRSVAIVEGYFDLFACRLLHPDAPVLSTGTKTVNGKHIHDLSMLGVRDVHLMFDLDKVKEGRTEGAGQQAARLIAEKYGNQSGMTFHVHALPATDPSDCLCGLRTAYALREQLRQIFPSDSVTDEDLAPC